MSDLKDEFDKHRARAMAGNEGLSPIRATLGIAKKKLTLALLVLAACDRPAPTWVGMDRSAVSCHGDSPLSYRQHCVGGGRAYDCVTEDGHSWQCAVVGTAQAPAERAR